MNTENNGLFLKLLNKRKELGIHPAFPIYGNNE